MTRPAPAGWMAAIAIAAVVTAACGGGGGRTVSAGSRTTTSSASATTVPPSGSTSVTPTTARGAPRTDPPATAPKPTTPEPPPTEPPPVNPCDASTGAPTKPKQAISFPDPGTIYGAATRVALAACATSGLPVHYALSEQTPSGVCTLDAAGTAVEFRGIGSCKVVSSQAGSTEYEAAQPVSRLLQKAYQQVEIRWTSPFDPNALYPPGRMTVSFQVLSAAPVTAQVGMVDTYPVCSADTDGRSIDNETNPVVTVTVDIKAPGPGDPTSCTLEPNVGGQFVSGQGDPRSYKIRP